MTVFRLQVFYQYGSLGKLSNVWHSDAADIPTLQGDVSSTMVDDLKVMLHPNCTLLRFLISDLAGTDFVTTEVGESGTSANDDELLPLFACAKVLFNDGGLGRPDLKYMKGLLTEAIQNNTGITDAFRGTLDTQMTTLLSDMSAAGSPLCSAEGGEYTGASVQQAVQMRQMHRRRKRTP